MSIIRWSPMWNSFDDMQDLFRRLPALRDMDLQRGFVPAMDVYETKDAVVVETPLAGVRPEDVQVNIEKGVLTVQGSHKKEHEIDEKNYYQKEVRSGSFFRQVALPVAVKEDKINAEFEEGILRISAPKATSVAAKKVQVQIKKKKIK